MQWVKRHYIPYVMPTSNIYKMNKQQINKLINDIERERNKQVIQKELLGFNKNENKKEHNLN